VGQRATARSAQQVAGSATGLAAARAGSAVQRAGAAVERHGTAVAPTVGTAVGAAVESVLDAADALSEVAGTLGGALRTAAGELVETISGIVEEPAVRGGAALDALRGIPVGPPASVRRWPWAVGAALLGAGAGAAVAYLLRRLQGQDAPGAQEPHELQAVVDLPARSTEDGAVLGTPPSPA
jgi:hypothetical protein